MEALKQSIRFRLKSEGFTFCQRRVLYRTILDTCQEGIVCLDAHSRVLVCNPSAERILQQPKEVVLATKPYDPLFKAVDEAGNPLQPEDHPSQIALRTGHPCLNVVQGIKNANGRITWININARPLPPNADGCVGGVVVSLSDITHAKELEMRLRTEAYRDALTGAYNRRYFQEVLERAVKAAERFGHPMSLAICDLDHFKQINDTHGHASGDRAIQAFSETIHWDMRRDDVAARIGGDEFCMIFMHAPAQSAAHFLERVRTQLEALEIPAENGSMMKLKASFGLASYAPGDSADKLFDKADLALYRAKAQGGNQVIILTESPSTASSRSKPEHA